MKEERLESLEELESRQMDNGEYVNGWLARWSLQLSLDHGSEEFDGLLFLWWLMMARAWSMIAM